MMVRALGYHGLESSRQLQQFYGDSRDGQYQTHQVFFAVALIMQFILKPHGSLPRGRNVADSWNRQLGWHQLYGALLADVRDFLRLRYRCAGFQTPQHTVIANLLGWSTQETVDIPRLDWAIRSLIRALDVMSRANSVEWEQFLPAIKGIRQLCRSADTLYDPMKDIVASQPENNALRVALEHSARTKAKVFSED
jgi:hypothetical protein